MQLFGPNLDMSTLKSCKYPFSMSNSDTNVDRFQVKVQYVRKTNMPLENNPKYTANASKIRLQEVSHS